MAGAALRQMLLVGFLLVAAPLRAHDPSAILFDERQALAYSQQAIGRDVGDHRFTDTQGKTVRLSELRGRPVVLGLIYTSCEHVCPLIVENLAHAVAVADKALGPDRFTVLTVGFDTKADTPTRMRDFARAHGIDRRGWHLLSTDATTIERLAAETGFLFAPRAGGFDHLTQTTILDADGRVYRQIYGEDFAAQTLVEPLKELAFGQPRQAGFFASLTNRVRLLCTIYDPASGRYRFSYAIFIGLAIGAASLLAVLVSILRLWQQTKRA